MRSPTGNSGRRRSGSNLRDLARWVTGDHVEPVAGCVLPDALRTCRCVRRSSAFDMAAYSDLVTMRRAGDRVRAELAGVDGHPAVPRGTAADLDENCWSPAARSELRIDLDAWTPACRARCATCRSSIATDATSARPTCCDPRGGCRGGVRRSLAPARASSEPATYAAHGGVPCGRPRGPSRCSAATCARRDQMADRMIAARRRASWLPEAIAPGRSCRRHGGSPRTTVALRRALSEGDRQRWLRLRLRAG